MESMEKRLERIEFYQQLIFEMIELEKYPFYKLIIEKKLTRGEVDGIYELCEELLCKYKEQKEAGFVNFQSLLVQFVGMLNPKLQPEIVIGALYEQGFYQDLMHQLKIIIEKEFID